jgi:hypothetical protein
MMARLLLVVAVGLVLGCGSKKFVPVSGRVTLNGTPLANATVAFQPSGEGKPLETAPGSSGKTNENGEYTLMTSTGQKGAAVGKHQVLISALDAKSEEDARRPRRGGPRLADKVPSRYGMRGKDELTFVVPPEGTDKADFPLTAP